MNNYKLLTTHRFFFFSVLRPPGAGKKRRKEKNGMLIIRMAPIKTLLFLSDEGTWMNVDLSPDGKEIVFDLI